MRFKAREYLLFLLSVGSLLFTQRVGVAQLVSAFLSRGIGLCAAVDSVCLWEEVGSGASRVPIGLELSSLSLKAFY